MIKTADKKTYDLLKASISETRDIGPSRITGKHSYKITKNGRTYCAYDLSLGYPKLAFSITSSFLKCEDKNYHHVAEVAKLLDYTE